MAKLQVSSVRYERQKSGLLNTDFLFIILFSRFQKKAAGGPTRGNRKWKGEKMEEERTRRVEKRGGGVERKREREKERER